MTEKIDLLQCYKKTVLRIASALLLFSFGNIFGQTIDSDLLIVSRTGGDINSNGFADDTEVDLFDVVTPFEKYDLWSYKNIAYNAIYLIENGDFNGDGFDDLVILEHYGSDVDGDNLGDNSHLKVFDGATKNQVWEIYGSGDGAGIYLLKTGNYNGDAFDDLAVGRHSGWDVSNPPDGIADNTFIKIYKGSSTGLVGDENTYWDFLDGAGMGASVFALESGNYGGSGADDLATLRYSGPDNNNDGFGDDSFIQVFSGSTNQLGSVPSWSLDWADGTNPIRRPYMLATGDFNNDAFDDLVVVRSAGSDINNDKVGDASQIRIYQGSTNWNLTWIKQWTESDFPTRDACYLMEVGDYNGDDYDDLVAVRYSGQIGSAGIGESAYLRVFSGNGFGQMWDLDSPAGNPFTLLKTGSFDDDSLNDLLVVRPSGSGGNNTELRCFSGEKYISVNHSTGSGDPGDWKIDGTQVGNIVMGQKFIGVLNNTIALQSTGHPRLLLPSTTQINDSSMQWTQLLGYANDLLGVNLPPLSTDSNVLGNYHAAIMSLAFASKFDNTGNASAFASTAQNLVDVLIADWSTNNIVKTGIIESTTMSGIDQKLKIGIYIEALAYGYDWLFSGINSVEQGTIEDILVECTDFLETLNGNYDNVYDNHTIWHALPVLHAGIVLPPERGEPYLLSMKQNIINKLFVALEEMGEHDGGWHEGPMYYMIVQLPRVGLFCELWRIAMNENLFDGTDVTGTDDSLMDGLGFLQHAGEYISWHTTPDYLYMRTGDIGQTSAVYEDHPGSLNTNMGNPGHGLVGGYFLQLVAQRIDSVDHNLAVYAQNYVNTICNGLNYPLTGHNRVYNIYSLLWENAVITTPSADLTKHFQGIGNVILRSEANDDAVIVKFECGDFFSNHDHYDQNSFTVYYKGNLAIDSGYYGKGSGRYANTTTEANFQLTANIGWPNFHQLNYSWRTAAHNSILAFKDPKNSNLEHDNNDQIYPWPYLSGNSGWLDFEDLVDDGGQFFDGKVRKWSNRDDMKFEKGNIAYVSEPPFSGNWYTIVRGNADEAYNNLKTNHNTLPKFQRDLVLVRPEAAVDADSYIIIFDNLNYAPDTPLNSELSWTLNVSEDANIPSNIAATNPNAIFIQGPKRTFSQIDPSWPSTSHSSAYSGDLYVQRLYPSTANSTIKHKQNFEVGSFNPSSPPHFDYSDSSFSSGHPRSNRDIGGQRIEVTLTNVSGSQYFLNVLYPTASDTSPMPTMELISSNDHLGCQIKSGNDRRNVIFMFGKKTNSTWVQYTVQHENISTRHVVTDLVPNKNYSVYYLKSGGNWQKLSTVMSSKDGIIEFNSSFGPGSTTFYATWSIFKKSDPEKKADNPIPEVYKLSQNHPNPFNSSTTIAYELPEAGRVLIKLYNIMGQEIKTLVDEVRFPGVFTANWDGKDKNGISVSSGVYVYVISVNDFKDVKKLTLLK